MRPAPPALVLVAVLGSAGCGGDEPTASPASPSASTAGYSAEVRENFLRSCVTNATQTGGGAASEEELTRTCECILGKVEQEYSEVEFAQFEQRLLGGTASEQETARLTQWSTSCADEATS